MEFKDFVCEKLKNAGDAKAKPMFGTYNISLDGVNLGLLCENKWYLKKTPAGDEFLAEHRMEVETGIKGNSYIIRDFSDEDKLCRLAAATRDALRKAKK